MEPTTPEDAVINQTPMRRPESSAEDNRRVEARAIANQVIEHGNLDLGREVLTQAGMSAEEINKIVAAQIDSASNNAQMMEVKFNQTLKAFSELGREVYNGTPEAMNHLLETIYGNLQDQHAAISRRSNDFQAIQRFLKK